MTTNKATYPFWPANIAKTFTKTPDHHNNKLNLILKHNGKVYDKTQYKVDYKVPLTSDEHVE